MSHYSTPRLYQKTQRFSTNRGPAGLLLVREPSSSAESSSAPHTPSDSVADERAHLVHSARDLSLSFIERRYLFPYPLYFLVKKNSKFQEYNNQPFISHLPHVSRLGTARLREVSVAVEAVSAVAAEARSSPETEMGRFPNKNQLKSIHIITINWPVEVPVAPRSVELLLLLKGDAVVCNIQ